jgi:hypothetical protein
VIESVKSENDSFLEQDSGGFFVASAKTNSMNKGIRSEESSFLDCANDLSKRSKFSSSKNVFSFNSSGSIKIFIKV